MVDDQCYFFYEQSTVVEHHSLPSHHNFDYIGAYLHTLSSAKYCKIVQMTY